MTELSPDERAKIVAAARSGAPAPDGPVIERFEPLALAQAIESELARCRDRGWHRVSLHMSVDDARAMAAALRMLPRMR